MQHQRHTDLKQHELKKMAEMAHELTEQSQVMALEQRKENAKLALRKKQQLRELQSQIEDNKQRRNKQKQEELKLELD